MNTHVLTKPTRTVNLGKDYLKIYLAVIFLAALVAFSLFAAGLLLSGQIEFSKIISFAKQFSSTEELISEEPKASADIPSTISSVAETPDLSLKLSAVISSHNSQVGDAEKYAALIVENAKKYSLDSFLLAALVYQESKFNNLNFNSEKIGLFMISAAEAQVLSAELKLPFMRAALYNPNYNIQLGTYKFSRLLEITKGDLEKALVAYKAGAFTTEGYTVGEVDPSLLQFKDAVIADAKKFSA